MLSELIWMLILQYHFTEDDSEMKRRGSIDYGRASQSLLKWIRKKIPAVEINNFTSDWNDGVALCLLVNSIMPETIHESVFSHNQNDEYLVRIALQAAQDTLGIPQLIEPIDIATNIADERSVMTYIALFRSADRMLDRGVVPSAQPSSNSSAFETISDSGSRRTPIMRCVAYGYGLRCGEVGKPAEFIVQLNDASASDLSISIECKPYEEKSPSYKPELRIKPVGEKSYIVRYTPTRPGDYVVSILYCGSHVANSPFRLSIKNPEVSFKCQFDEGLNLSIEPTISSPSDFKFLPSDDELKSSEISKPINGFFKHSNTELLPESNCFRNSCKAEGLGLLSGEVGVMAHFNVYTPSEEKWPLSVCITCPAMSIPAPHIRTNVNDTLLVHDVMYLPTEPGIYEIEIKWGNKLVGDAPYRLVISEAKDNLSLSRSDTNLSMRSRSPLRASSPIRSPTRSPLRTPVRSLVPTPISSPVHTGLKDNSRNITLYYSITSLDSKHRREKEHLESILKQELRTMAISSIAIDLELLESERKEILEEASYERLPFVFADNSFFGTYDDIVKLYRQGELRDYFTSNIVCKDNSSLNSSDSSLTEIFKNFDRY